MSNQNPPVWEQAAEDIARAYVPQVPTGNTAFLASLLNGLEQGIAFASAHLDQLKAHAAQIRNLIGQ